MSKPLYRSLAPRRALLLASLLAATPLGAEDLRQRQVLGDLAVILSVSAPGHSTVRAQDAAPGDAGGGLHRLVVTLADADTGAPVAGARVSAYVAEHQYAGDHFPFIPDAGRPGTYRADVPMPGRPAYRILVRVHARGTDRAREAQFEYRHHH